MARRSDIPDGLLEAAAKCLPALVWWPLSRDGEAALVGHYVAMLHGKSGRELAESDGIPCLECCNIELEFPLPRGKADIVIFHQDGGATVIEAKDGAGGRRSVLAGLGQVASYAYQIGASKAPPRYVKNVLLWSACIDSEDNEHIEDVCRATGVIPILTAPVAKHRQASMEFVRETLERLGVTLP